MNQALDVTVHNGAQSLWQIAASWIVPGLVAVAGLLLGQWFTKRREDRHRDHQRRREVYTEFLRATADVRHWLNWIWVLAGSDVRHIREGASMTQRLAKRMPTLTGFTSTVEQGKALLVDIELLSRTSWLPRRAAFFLEMIDNWQSRRGSDGQPFMGTTEDKFFIDQAYRSSDDVVRVMRQELGLPVERVSSIVTAIVVRWWSLHTFLRRVSGRQP